jgi:hypothetical protein
MKKLFLLVIALLLGLMALFWWQAPTILAMVPSRYIAAYAPAPIQQLAVSHQPLVLPTAAVAVDMALLLPPTSTPTAVPLPPTLTPIPTTGAAGIPTLTPPPTATPLPTIPPTATPLPFPPQARLEGITHHFQEWNNCGPATLSMAMTYFGVYHNQAKTSAVLKPDPEDRNVTPDELANYVNTQTDLQAISRTNGDFDILRGLISSGVPVIIETGIDPPGSFSWMEWYGHYLLVVAYDDAAETIWVFDSWLGTNNEIPEAVTTEDGQQFIEFGVQNGEGRTMDYATFDYYWRQFNRNYVALYRPEQVAQVAQVIGAQMDDGTMWARALGRTAVSLQTEPEDPFLWFNLGTIYAAQQEYALASAAFDQARAIGLPGRMLWYQFGPYEAYYQVGRYADVLELTNLTLNNRPYFEESFYYRGLAQKALGNDRAAEADFSAAFRFNPNFLPAAQALGR